MTCHRQSPKPTAQRPAASSPQPLQHAAGLQPWRCSVASEPAWLQRSGRASMAGAAPSPTPDTPRMDSNMLPIGPTAHLVGHHIPQPIACQQQEVVVLSACEHCDLRPKTKTYRACACVHVRAGVVRKDAEKIVLCHCQDFVCHHLERSTYFLLIVLARLMCGAPHSVCALLDQTVLDSSVAQQMVHSSSSHRTFPGFAMSSHEPIHHSRLAVNPKLLCACAQAWFLGIGCHKMVSSCRPLGTPCAHQRDGQAGAWYQRVGWRFVSPPAFPCGRRRTSTSSFLGTHTPLAQG